MKDVNFEDLQPEEKRAAGKIRTGLVRLNQLTGKGYHLEPVTGEWSGWAILDSSGKSLMQTTNLAVLSVRFDSLLMDKGINK